MSKSVIALLLWAIGFLVFAEGTSQVAVRASEKVESGDAVSGEKAKTKVGSAAVKAKAEELPITDADFVEPFGKYLKADRILLKRGGVRFIKQSDGSIVVLSVGRAPADSDDMEDIAEMDALSKLTEMLAGTSTSVLSVNVYECHQTTKDGKTEFLEINDFATTNSVSASSLVKAGETVGTWYSANGKKFFMAKGKIVAGGIHEGDK